MEELYVEGLASHGGPESCVDVREGVGENLRESALGAAESTKLLTAVLEEYRRKAVLMVDLSTVAWRKSSFSNGGGACVEVMLLDDGRTAVRNSNDPDAGVVLFTRAEMDTWIKGVKAGEFDDLT